MGRASSAGVTGGSVRIRPEAPGDAAVIARVVKRAFEGHPHSAGTEARIVRTLRAADALSVSLVAEVGGQVLGYVAASPVSVAGQPSSWHGLGPVAVDPTIQRAGTGSALVAECLARLRDLGAAGCVVLGEPAFYGRFGFEPGTGLTFAEALEEYFMALSFGASLPRGEVTYHAAFTDPG